MTKQETHSPRFEETSIGAVVLLSIMFLSGGLALIGMAKLVSRWLTRAEQ